MKLSPDAPLPLPNDRVAKLCFQRIPKLENVPPTDTEIEPTGLDVDVDPDHQGKGDRVPLEVRRDHAALPGDGAAAFLGPNQERAPDHGDGGVILEDLTLQLR